MFLKNSGFTGAIVMLVSGVLSSEVIKHSSYRGGSDGLEEKNEISLLLLLVNISKDPGALAKIVSETSHGFSNQVQCLLKLYGNLISLTSYTHWSSA